MIERVGKHRAPFRAMSRVYSLVIGTCMFWMGTDLAAILWRTR